MLITACSLDNSACSLVLHVCEHGEISGSWSPLICRRVSISRISFPPVDGIEVRRCQPTAGHRTTGVRGVMPELTSDSLALWLKLTGREFYVGHAGSGNPLRDPLCGVPGVAIRPSVGTGALQDSQHTRPCVTRVTWILPIPRHCSAYALW